MSDLAPPILASEWLNTPEPLTLEGLCGRVVVIECFQMLCPGCVSHGLPQAQRIAQTFRPQDVAVIGLHCVFEHHAAMTPLSLRAFLHEYRIRFPVAVDMTGDMLDDIVGVTANNVSIAKQLAGGGFSMLNITTPSAA